MNLRLECRLEMVDCSGLGLPHPLVAGKNFILHVNYFQKRQSGVLFNASKTFHMLVKSINIRLKDVGLFDSRRDSFIMNFLCLNLQSPFILSLLGYSSDRSGRKLVLVFELMENQSLQDALLDQSFVSAVEESKSVVTNTTVGFDQLPESFNVRVLDSYALSEVEVGVVLPEMSGVEKLSVLSDGCFDKFSVDSGNQRKRGGDGCLREWIGSEIKKERPKSSYWVGSGSSICSGAGDVAAPSKVDGKKKQRKKLEWWASLDEEKIKGKKYRKLRDWWKEEFCEELSKKSRKKKKSLDCHGESWWQRDEDIGSVAGVKKKKRKSKSSKGNIDWWLEGLSGDLRNNGRRNSQDWGYYNL
ncbi:hypothetical protein RYX36_028033 [Vicia faba]